ncbi:MAG TPA: hypothetical protein DDY66_09280 [Prevotella sp.]|uniref:hypothetical protein n=1 Tax=Segatella copri TaxID=165179 RepID=UPI000E7F6F6A|nr:hypothetical protein [Segatella copri]MCW4101382.1 hypothetical protein [Segatella copri]HBI99467.1 hypothetical protein [Prevotella sp.]HBJ03945.1 hypothetical protein [Prevotella sp.]
MDIFVLRKYFIIVQVFVFLLALLYDFMVGNSNDYTIILFYSLWNIGSYLWLFIKELRLAPDFHPYQILALVAAQFIGVSGISTYLQLMTGESILFGSTVITHAVYLGIIYLSLQHILLFAVFFFMENRHKDDEENTMYIADRIMNSNVPYFKWALYFYVFVWAMRIISLLVPLESISSLFVTLATGGYIVTLFLLTFAMIQNPLDRKGKMWHWGIVALEIALVMNHGMKEEIIRPLVPYCVHILILYKAGYKRFNSKTIVQVGLIGAFVILFVFPYISIFRTISYSTGKKWDQITTSETLSEYMKYINKEGKYAYDGEERGVGYMMNRAGSVGCNAFSIDYAKTKGTQPQYLAYCGAAIIPRIIWKDKPSVVIGGMAYMLANKKSNWSNAKSSDAYGCSVSLGYIGSLYLSIGFGGAILAICLQSLLLWYLWHFYKKKILYNIVAVWAFSSLIFVLLKDFEAFQDCGLSFCTWALVYVFICSKIFPGPKYLIES